MRDIEATVKVTLIAKKPTCELFMVVLMEDGQLTTIDYLVVDKEGGEETHPTFYAARDAFNSH